MENPSIGIPNFEKNGNLPTGIYLATWQEIEDKLAFNARRKELLSGLKRACQPLKQAGCKRIYIGGSFVTNKEFPQDFDICWDEDEADLTLLEQIEPLFFSDLFIPHRPNQKAKYGGEFFPANNLANWNPRKTFLQFFQEDRNGNLRGIVEISL
jgi:hypothetical protein